MSRDTIVVILIGFLLVSCGIGKSKVLLKDGVMGTQQEYNKDSFECKRMALREVRPKEIVIKYDNVDKNPEEKSFSQTFADGFKKGYGKSDEERYIEDCLAAKGWTAEWVSQY